MSILLNWSKKIIFWTGAIIGSLFFGYASQSMAAASSVQVQLIVQGCNNNLSCEAGIGENSINCPIDCGTASPAPTTTPAPSSAVSGSSGGYYVPSTAVGTLVNPTVTSVVSAKKKVAVRWINPQDSNFETVRLTRTTYAYPQDPSEGRIIYEGSGSSAVDVILEEGVRYYYTLFAQDIKGNYSSGAVFSVDVQNSEEVTKRGSSGTSTGSRVSSDSVFTTADPLIGKLAVADFIFTQDDKRLPFVRGRVNIDGDKPLTVALPYEALPEILKTIVLHVNDPEDPSQTAHFLLRVNDTKTMFEGTVGAFGRFGEAKFSIEIIDFNQKVLHKTDGTFSIYRNTPQTSGFVSAVKTFFQSPTDPSSGAELIFFLTLLLLYVFRKMVSIPQ